MFQKLIQVITYLDVNYAISVTQVSVDLILSADIQTMYIVQYSKYTRLDIIESRKVSMMLPCNPAGCRVTRRELRGRMVGHPSSFACRYCCLGLHKCYYYYGGRSSRTHICRYRIFLVQIQIFDDLYLANMNLV